MRRELHLFPADFNRLRTGRTARFRVDEVRPGARLRCWEIVRRRGDTGPAPRTGRFKDLYVTDVRPDVLGRNPIVSLELVAEGVEPDPYAGLTNLGPRYRPATAEERAP